MPVAAESMMGSPGEAPLATPGEAFLRLIPGLAVRALYYELTTEPKPGLVTLTSPGSHEDMDASAFLRSLFALRQFFPRLAEAAFEGAGLFALRQIGIEAEKRMLAATGGVNTHRGAIFGLGLLTAAAARLCASAQRLSSPAIFREIKTHWGNELRERSPDSSRTHGEMAFFRFGAGGARAEAAAGFPTVQNIALPAFRSAIAISGCLNLASVQTLFALMASVDDTNLLHRGGREGAAFVKATAKAFLENGGVIASDWKHRAGAAEAAFVSRRLSPGGSADLLSATLFLW
jgi:triphosphoribosyl-dephospho-CoA synthase